MSKSMYGVDLGTYEIKVYDAVNDMVHDYKNAIAIQKIMNKKHVFAAGDHAYEMYEKVPSDISVVFPMEGGVISDFDSMQYLMQHLIFGERKSHFGGAGYLLSAPTDMTEVEKKALFDLIVHSDARTRDVRLVPSAIADAIGFGIDVLKEKGIFLVNIGAAKTEYSVISGGGLLLNKMEKFGGNMLNHAITSYIRREYSFLIGIFAAEELKTDLGAAIGTERSKLLVPGRSLVSGLPGEIEIDSDEIHSAIKPVLSDILSGCEAMLERVPPEMMGNIRESGLFLTGGVSYLRNIGKYFERELKLPVHLHKRPEHSTIEGIRKILLTGDYGELTYAMLDNRNRWIK